MSLGNIDLEKNEKYSAEFSAFFGEKLGLKADRGYILFNDPGNSYLGCVPVLKGLPVRDLIVFIGIRELHLLRFSSPLSSRPWANVQTSRPLNMYFLYAVELCAPIRYVNIDYIEIIDLGEFPSALETIAFPIHANSAGESSHWLSWVISQGGSTA